MESRKEVRVLIIDEHDGWCEQLRQFAEMNDHLYEFQIERHSTGLTALKALREFGPTVVIVEAHLTDIDPFALVRTCRDELTPVVVTSEECSDEIEESAFQNGAAGYVVHTDNPDHLEHFVLQLATLSTQKEIAH